MSLDKKILERIKTLAYQNAFNDKQTKGLIDLVNSGTSIDKAIEMIEEGDLPKNVSVMKHDTEKNIIDEMILSEQAREAIESFKQAIKISPDNAKAHYNLGVAYISLSDRGSAMGQMMILRRLDYVLSYELYNLIKNLISQCFGCDAK